MSDDRFDRGMELRRAVMGDQYVDRAEANKTDLTADFQHLITEFAWGSVWSRPGLEPKTRSMLTIAILATLRQYTELTAHIRASMNTGVSQEELTEILLQVAVYAGVPAANSAFAIAQKVYAEASESTQEDKK